MLKDVIEILIAIVVFIAIIIGTPLILYAGYVEWKTNIVFKQTITKKIDGISSEEISKIIDSLDKSKKQ